MNISSIPPTPPIVSVPEPQPLPIGQQWPNGSFGD